MGILRLLVIFALILAQFLGLSEGAYSWEEGVSQCWSTNEVRYKNKLSNVDGDPWICQPEKGTGPRKCIKIRFDGTVLIEFKYCNHNKSSTHHWTYYSIGFLPRSTATQEL